MLLDICIICNSWGASDSARFCDNFVLVSSQWRVANKKWQHTKQVGCLTKLKKIPNVSTFNEKIYIFEKMVYFYQDFVLHICWQAQTQSCIYLAWDIFSSSSDFRSPRFYTLRKTLLLCSGRHSPKETYILDAKKIKRCWLRNPRFSQPDPVPVCTSFE